MNCQLNKRSSCYQLTQWLQNCTVYQNFTSLACHFGQSNTSMIDSPAYLVAGFLTKIISPVLGQTEHTVSNSAQFVGQVKSLTLSQDDIMVSFDVTSLFTRVSTDKAIDAVCEKLLKDETLPDRCGLSVDSIRALMKESLNRSYFQCGGQLYRQLEGWVRSSLSN